MGKRRLRLSLGDVWSRFNVFYSFQIGVVLALEHNFYGLTNKNDNFAFLVARAKSLLELSDEKKKAGDLRLLLSFILKALIKLHTSETINALYEILGYEDWYIYEDILTAENKRLLKKFWDDNKDQNSNGVKKAYAQYLRVSKKRFEDVRSNLR